MFDFFVIKACAWFGSMEANLHQLFLWNSEVFKYIFPVDFFFGVCQNIVIASNDVIMIMHIQK